MSRGTIVGRLLAGLTLGALCVGALHARALADDNPPFGGTLREEVGVNIHFAKPLPGEMEMMHRLGVGAIRMDISWSSIEKQKGVYDFRDYDVLIKNLEQNHIRPLLILDYGNPLYADNGTPDDPEWRADFTRWAVATVTHFAGRHVLWEMWNEPNSTKATGTSIWLWRRGRRCAAPHRKRPTSARPGAALTWASWNTASRPGR